MVAFEIVGNLDSADLLVMWDVEVDSIRFVDGQGFTDSEDNISISEDFGFDEEETADLDISEASNNPEATTLKIDDGDDESDEFNVFVFDIEEDKGVDVTIDDMRFTVLTLGTTTENDVVEEMVLYQGSTELASESVPDGGVVNFENLGITIDGDSTEEFTIAMTFKGTDTAGVASNVKVTFTSITDAEDEYGNDEGEMTTNYSAVSETHTLRTVVPEVTDTGFTTPEKAEDDKSGTISFEFTISAEDDDFAFGVATKAAVDGTSDDIRFTTTGASSTLGAAAITRVSGDAVFN